ncbi:hypothetical protein CMUS01_13176 [Colletotrichum musicola]|uniref:Uncharacterized protein n=1 Tax=Colletotrichum musicola TaxID=2175873 RepID=A0A8H6JFD0_9PEZI|nr:hypothetical protein CMUS01_13176 [Colletotrichum musicola]
MVFYPYGLPKGHPDADENFQARRSLIDITAAMLLYFRRPVRRSLSWQQALASTPLRKRRRRPKTSLGLAYEWQDRLSAGTLEKQPIVAAYQPRQFVLPGGEKKIDMRLIKPKPLSRAD